VSRAKPVLSESPQVLVEVAIEEVSMQSADENWNPKDVGQQHSRKLFKLQNFSVFFLKGHHDGGGVKEMFLEPLSCLVKVTDWNDIRFEFAEIFLRISKSDYLNAIELYEVLGNYSLATSSINERIAQGIADSKHYLEIVVQPAESLGAAEKEFISNFPSSRVEL
jgi:hypothetical protein